MIAQAPAQPDAKLPQRRQRGPGQLGLDDERLAALGLDPPQRLSPPCHRSSPGRVACLDPPDTRSPCGCCRSFRPQPAPEFPGSSGLRSARRSRCALSWRLRPRLPGTGGPCRSQLGASPITFDLPRSLAKPPGQSCSMPSMRIFLPSMGSAARYSSARAGAVRPSTKRQTMASQWRKLRLRRCEVRKSVQSACGMVIGWERGRATLAREPSDWSADAPVGPRFARGVARGRARGPARGPARGRAGVSRIRALVRLG